MPESTAVSDSDTQTSESEVDEIYVDDCRSAALRHLMFGVAVFLIAGTFFTGGIILAFNGHTNSVANVELGSAICGFSFGGFSIAAIKLFNCITSLIDYAVLTFKEELEYDKNHIQEI